MAGSAALAALRAVARECQLAAPSFTDEQAAQGLAVADELRARFLPPASSAQAASPLLQLPAELLSVILSRLDTRDLARLAATCLLLWQDAQPPPPPPRAIGPVEMELRRRAEARGLDAGSALPDAATSWVPNPLKRDRRDAQMRRAPLAAGHEHGIFVDTGGRLLTCGRDYGHTPLLGQAVDPAADPNYFREIGPPTPVSSMQDIRIVSVATSNEQSLALSAEGEVYSWGAGDYGSLGHGDFDDLAVPSRIRSLSRIERIAAGPNWTSAAVDEDGRLFTWGRASFFDEEEDSDGEQEGVKEPNGLGYELDSEVICELTPVRVDALSQDRVVGVALGIGFTLAVTDAGAVFSFGLSRQGALGHGSLESEVLPRRIHALAETGRRFIAVAAGHFHALALTEGGELYGWGNGHANSHGRVELTPHRAAALIGQRVKLVLARASSSCAVTENGELFTWGFAGSITRGYSLSHGVTMHQATPKRVEALVGARIVAVAMGVTHTLAADEDGVMWAFGERVALGLGGPNPEGEEGGPVKTPTPIPTLRVRALKSP